MENEIRLKAFSWLEEQIKIYGDVLPRKILEKGFYFNNKRITLIGAQGIWKPKVFDSVPISITTSPKGPYNDSFTKDGFLQYKYMGTNPNHWVNKGLREAMKNQIPLIYFHGIVPGKYLAVWPVYIIYDNPSTLTFTAAADDANLLANKNTVSDNVDNSRRRYITSSVRVRLHQKAFREKVMHAYDSQCTLCRLRHLELLDAAHIIPDSDKTGDPIISNGLSLCKIHHAAFDSNIIGISPDYIVKVNKNILLETDGPMLKYGIQKLQNQKISLPKNKTYWPDRDRLDRRYSKFKSII